MQTHNGLASYRDICDALALLFSPFVEVVLHDLSSATVVHIANNFSKRKLGDPSLLNEIDFNPSDRVIGPYEKVNWDGRHLKSISIVIRDDQERAVALLCVNSDVSHFHAIRQVIEQITVVPGNKTKPDALFREDWHEQINEFVNAWVTQQNTSLANLSRTQRKQLVLALQEQGVFNARNSINYVARVIGVGRATVYNYLRENKNT